MPLSSSTPPPSCRTASDCIAIAPDNAQKDSPPLLLHTRSFPLPLFFPLPPLSGTSVFSASAAPLPRSAVRKSCRSDAALRAFRSAPGRKTNTSRRSENAPQPPPGAFKRKKADKRPPHDVFSGPKAVSNYSSVASALVEGSADDTESIRYTSSSSRGRW